MPTAKVKRELRELKGIGPAMLKDFELLGIHSVEQLADQNSNVLYDRLSQMAGVRMDPCVLDTFDCAIAQARNPRLSTEKTNWWYYSRKRKAASRRT